MQQVLPMLLLYTGIYFYTWYWYHVFVNDMNNYFFKVPAFKPLGKE